jgi:hypothetical protein
MDGIGAGAEGRLTYLLNTLPAQHAISLAAPLTVSLCWRLGDGQIRKSRRLGTLDRSLACPLYTEDSFVSSKIKAPAPITLLGAIATCEEMVALRPIKL